MAKFEFLICYVFDKKGLGHGDYCAECNKPELSYADLNAIRDHLAKELGIDTVVLTNVIKLVSETPAQQQKVANG